MVGTRKLYGRTVRIYDDETKRRAIDLRVGGASLNAISRELGVPVRTVQGWMNALRSTDKPDVPPPFELPPEEHEPMPDEWKIRVGMHGYQIHLVSRTEPKIHREGGVIVGVLMTLTDDGDTLGYIDWSKVTSVAWRKA